MHSWFDLSAISRRRSAKFALASSIAVLAIALVTFTAQAWWIGTVSSSKQEMAARLNTEASPTFQNPPRSRSRLHGRLSLQPEADKQRRRLGQRFFAPGREVSVLVGALTIGSERYTARITRIQDDDDERLTIALNGGGPTLTWSGLNGALSDGNAATGSLRALIERLALDSPDQFILAQLRGAAYYTVARDARPAEAGDADNYAGPRWDLVRVAEPINLSQNRPQSLWRLYFINSSTGLIDKVVSQEQGNTVTVDISGWVTQAGETIPTRVVWKRNNQAIMDLTITNVSHNPKQ